MYVSCVSGVVCVHCGVLQLVPPQTANPGFGQFILVPDAHHMNVCKPEGREAMVYTTLLAFLRELLASN